MSEFNIGDRVKVKSWEEIPETDKCKSTSGNPSLWNSGKSKICGKSGVIVDKMYSEAYERFVYRIRFDDSIAPSNYQITADNLKLDEEHPQYTYNIAIEDGVVVAVLYETVGDKTKEVGRGHGHIMHDGVIGVAQAASYALKRIYIDMNEGKLLCYNMEEDRYE